MQKKSFTKKVHNEKSESRNYTKEERDEYFALCMLKIVALEAIDRGDFVEKDGILTINIDDSFENLPFGDDDSEEHDECGDECDEDEN